MAVIGLVIAGLAFLLSVIFNILQYGWRVEDKAEQKRKENQSDAQQRKKEQAPPEFFNFGGASHPIRLTGSQHSVHGPFVDLWGLVTVVNPTQTPVKITPLRLVVAGNEWPVQKISFHVKSNTQNRSERISIRGNDKEDYELHFLFPENKCPTHDGEIWFKSDNRPEEFSVPVSFIK